MLLTAVGPLWDLLADAPLSWAFSVWICVVFNLLVGETAWIWNWVDAFTVFSWTAGFVLGVELNHTSAAVGRSDWFTDAFPAEAAVGVDEPVSLFEVTAVGPHWPVGARIAALNFWAFSALLSDGPLSFVGWAGELPPSAFDLWTAFSGSTVLSLFVTFWAGDDLVDAFFSWAAFSVDSGGLVLARKTRFSSWFISLVSDAFVRSDASTLVAVLFSAFIVDISQLLAFLASWFGEFWIPGGADVFSASVAVTALVLVFILAARLAVGLFETFVLTGVIVAGDWLWCVQIASDWCWWEDLALFRALEHQALVLRADPWAVFMSVVFIAVFTAWAVFRIDTLITVKDETVWAEAGFAVLLNLTVLDSHVVFVLVLACFLDTWTARLVDLISSARRWAAGGVFVVDTDAVFLALGSVRS